MTTITPALLAEIRTAAEKGVSYGRLGYWTMYPPQTMLALVAALEEAQRERDSLKAARWDVKHADTMNDIASLEIALRGVEAERDAAVKAHNECTEWLKESEAARDAALAERDEVTRSAVREMADLMRERDALEAENEKLRAALTVARGIFGMHSGQLLPVMATLIATEQIDAALKETTHAD